MGTHPIFESDFDCLTEKMKLLLQLVLLELVSGVRFFLSPGNKKCLKEEIHKDVVVTGEYSITPSQKHRVDIKVIDSKQHVLYNKEGDGKQEDQNGKFAFTTDDQDVFEVCFHSVSLGGFSSDPKFHEISIAVRKGVEAKSYDETAKTEKLKPLEVELRRLEDLSDSIVNDFQYMKQREEEMRSTNESTNSRVLYFSIFSMLCLVGLATWQVLYLRKFFKSKKLID